jgi:hypothetical protein
MAFQYINTGTSANKGDGDTLRTAFHKINTNFSQIGNETTSTVTITDTSNIPVVDIKVYKGTFEIPVSSVTSVPLLGIDTAIYRSASIDIYAEDTIAGTQDSGSSYMVTWNSSTSHILGTGIVSLNQNGSTGNALWDLDTDIVDNDLRVLATNVSGTTTSNVISWKAKVSLFRL